MLKECRLPQRGCSLMEPTALDPTALVMIWVTSTSSHVGSHPIAGSSWKGGLEVCDSNHSFSNIGDIRPSHCANVQRNSTTSRVRSPLWQLCKRSLGPVDWIKERGFVCLLYFNTCVEFKNKKTMIQSSTDVNKASFPSISKETPVVEQQAVVSTRDFNTPMVRLARRSNYIACEAEWYTKSQRCYTPSALTESLSRSLNARVKLTVGTHATEVTAGCISSRLLLIKAWKIQQSEAKREQWSV